MVEPDGGVSDGAPSFQQTAGDPEKTTAHLRAWLAAAHSEIPDFNLSRLEIGALIAYIENLGNG